MEKIIKLLLILFLLFFQSCYSQEKKQLLLEKKLIILDSIPLFTENLFFQAANFQGLSKKKLFVWEYTKNSLYSLDLENKRIQFINSKETKPHNFVGNEIYPFLHSDTLYVLETGNNSHLKIYDAQNSSLIDNLPLYKFLGEYGLAPPPFAYVQGYNTIYVPLTSKVAHFHESSYYDKKNPVFGKISLKEKSIFSYSTFIKFGDFIEIERALNENKKWWFAPDFVSTISKEKLYLAPPFSENIYVYDLKNDKMSKIELKVPNYKINYTVKFDEILQGEESIEQQIKLLRANSRCSALQVVGDKIYYLYNKAFGLEQLPKDIRKDFSQTIPDYILLIYDVKSKVTEFINIGKKFRPNSLYVSDKNEVFLISSPLLADNIYAYQISWK